MISSYSVVKVLKLASIWALLILIGQGQVLAQDPNRVAVVVRMSDDQVVTQCVAFEEEQISGYDALRRSDLPVLAGFDAQGGTICQISDQGCPAEDCFCQCKGGPECIYWSYWHQQDESWQYAQVGATAYKVNDKDVEGWSWGPGTVAKAIEPPGVTFDEVCDSTVAVLNVSQDTEENAQNNWLQYVLFTVVLGFLAASLIYRRIRGGSQ